MKVLLMSDGFPPAVLGGSGQIAWNTARGLAERGHDVSVLTATADGSVPAMPSGVQGYSIHKQPLRWAHYRGVFSRVHAQTILKIIEEVKPDIIHAHAIAWQMGYRWIPLAHAHGIPVVVTAHDVMHVAYGRVTGLEQSVLLKDLIRSKWTLNPLRNTMIRTILNTHCRTLSVSNALRTYMHSRGIASETLHNAIDLSEWQSSQTQEEARHALGIPQGKTVFLLAGRLGVDKGTKLITRTLPHDSLLLLAGDADLGEFEAVKDRVIFHGRQNPETMRTFYTAADAVLVPSVCLDCFPTVCLEAHAMSRTVLSSSWGGGKELVKDNVTGWIIDPLNEDAWAKRLTWCDEHRADLVAMGMAGRKRVEEAFTMDNHLKRLEQIYHEEIAK
jgi:glycosyltransferase involved in cell wall biosynthesis